MSLGLFLLVCRGLLICFQALNHFAVPKKSSECKSQEDSYVVTSAKPQLWAEMCSRPRHLSCPRKGGLSFSGKFCLVSLLRELREDGVFSGYPQIRVR